MKLSNVLAIPQNLCADNKKGVKSVHCQSQCLVIATHFIQKEASGRMPLMSQNQRFRAVGMMENGMYVSATARQLGMSKHC